MNDWFEQAQQDFKAATFNRENGFNGVASFLYQQAVEKAFKGLLIEQGKGLRKTHDVLALAQAADAPQQIQTLSDTLSGYYGRNRYPDTPDIELHDAKLQALHDAAEEVLEWTNSQR